MEALILQPNLSVTYQCLKRTLSGLVSEENTTKIGVGLDYLAALFSIRALTTGVGTFSGLLVLLVVLIVLVVLLL